MADIELTDGGGNTTIEENKAFARRAIQWDAERKAAILNNPGTVPPPPPPPSAFSKIVAEMEAEKIAWLKAGCPEVTMPSIANAISELEHIEFSDVLDAQAPDTRHIVETLAKREKIDPVFTLCGFIKGGTACSGLRTGLRHGEGEGRLDRATLHIASIGESNAGKGRGDKHFRGIIENIEDESAKEYDKLYDAWYVAAAEYDNLTKKEKQEEGAQKIKRPPRMRIFTVSPTEGAVVEIHTANPHAGVALWTGEMGNALGEMTKHTKGGSEETARNFCISGFDANESHRRDKMFNDGERGDLTIPNFGLSMLGSLQTPYAKAFFVGKFAEAQGRGSCERFLMLTGEEIPVDKNDPPTLEKMRDTSGNHEIAEMKAYLDKKYRAMTHFERTNEFYILAQDWISDHERKNIKELNEFIEAKLQLTPAIFRLQETAWLELARFIDNLKDWRQNCDYSSQEKAAVGYDEMKIAKIISVLHYFKWADLPLRKKNPTHYLHTEMAKYADIEREYRDIDLKYMDISRIPVTIDTVQAAIKIVMFAATCRRALFNEDTAKDEARKAKAEGENRKLAFSEWISLNPQQQPKTVAEVVAMKCPVLKGMSTSDIKKFLKDGLGITPTRAARGMVYDFSGVAAMDLIPVPDEDPRRPTVRMFRKR